MKGKLDWMWRWYGSVGLINNITARYFCGAGKRNEGIWDEDKCKGNIRIINSEITVIFKIEGKIQQTESSVTWGNCQRELETGIISIDKKEKEIYFCKDMHLQMGKRLVKWVRVSACVCIHKRGQAYCVQISNVDYACYEMWYVGYNRLIQWIKEIRLIVSSNQRKGTQNAFE